MKRVKYYLTAVVIGLSAFVGMPVYAEPDSDTIVLDNNDVILVGDPDDLLNSGDAVSLTTVTANPTEISVAIGEEKYIAVSYNDGFVVSDIDAAGVTYKSGDYQYTAFVGFEGNYDGEIFAHDYNTVYVYGNQMGSAVYTITVEDKDGNEASTDFTVTVRDALGSDYDAIDGDCGDGPDDECVIYESGATFGTPIEGGRDYKMQLVPMTDVLKALDGNLNSVFDLYVIDANGAVVPVADNNIEIWFGIRMAELGELADADQLFFQVVSIEDGVIVKYFDTEDVEDDGWGWMFTVKGITHFSQYGILVSDTPFPSAEDRNNAILPPNTGTFTGDAAGVTANYVALIATVTAMAVILLGYKIVEYRRK